MTDPILDEVRRFRTEHVRRFNFDLHAICADIRRFETVCGHEVAVVKLPPKRIEPDKLGSSTRGSDGQMIWTSPLESEDILDDGVRRK